MEFWSLLGKFIPIYKWRIISYILLIVLSSIFSIFSFATIIPLLQLLFGLSDIQITYIDASTIKSFDSFLNFVEVNALCFIQEQMLMRGGKAALFIIALFLIITSALSNLISYFAYYVRIPIRIGISRDLRNEVYFSILSMSVGAFSSENKGDFISRMTNDVTEVDCGIGVAMDMLIKEPIKIIVYIFTLVSISFVLTVEALTLLCVSCFVIAIVGKTMKKLALLGQQCIGRILSTFEETLGKLKFIKIFNLNEYFYGNFQKLNQNTMEVLIKTNRWYSIAWPLTDFLLTINIALLLCLGGNFILSSTYLLSAEKFIYFLVVFFSIIPPIRNITKSTYGIRKAMASVERMSYVLSIDKEEKREEVLVKRDLENLNIIFDNVSFAYKDNVVFKNKSLKIPTNQFSLITGKTGVGKTTLFNLLLKLYKPLSGKILLNGVDIELLSTIKLRDMITYVSQDTVLFNDSILENIRIGNCQSDFENVKKVANIVGLHDFINSLPLKYNTIVGDQGMNLSNGQRQKIAIARAILRNSPILILDEATNSMDTASESCIYDILKQLYKERTIIVISHNENLELYADNIITIEN